MPNPYAHLSRMNRDVREQVKSFTLPVSGSVVLYGPEIDIIDTEEFQRLDGIKQLGTSYLVYRGARHTRFEHSLGTLHEAQRMIDKLESNPRRDIAPIDDDARILARLAALLHDLPHVPFGHTLEDELGLLQRHDDNPLRMRVLFEESRIGEIIREHLGKHRFEWLRALLTAKSDKDFAKLKYPFVADIIGNTLCSDLLDYARRDLFYCGLPVGIGEHFLSYLTLTSAADTPEPIHQDRLALMLDKKGQPRPDVESEVVKLLETRYELAERVYFHHAKNAASVMIGRAVFAAGLAPDPATPDVADARFHWLTDASLLQVLEDPGVAAFLPQPIDLTMVTPEDPELATELARRVRTRRLYKMIYLASADDVGEASDHLHSQYGDPFDRIALENRIARFAGVPVGHVLIYLPRPKMMTKDADVRVFTSKGAVIKLSDWDRKRNGRIESLNEAHRRLWRACVYVHPDHVNNKTIVRRIRALAHDAFHAPSRLLEPGVDEPVEIQKIVELVFAQEAHIEGWTPNDLEALTALAPHEVADSYETLIEAMRDRIEAARSAKS